MKSKRPKKKKVIQKKPVKVVKQVVKQKAKESEESEQENEKKKSSYPSEKACKFVVCCYFL